MRKATCATVALAIALRGGIGGAQSSTEAEANAIDAAVASFLRSSLPTSGVAFETRAKVGGGWTESRSASRIEALARALPGVPVHQDTMIRCGELPSSCSLRGGVRTLLSFADARVSGTSATVRASRVDMTGYTRIPLSRQEFELHLIREGSAWRVVSKRVLSST